MKTKAKDTPEVQNMLEAFNSQKHKLELNGCEMLYNGKPFQLGMTIKELIDIFGTYDLFNRRNYVWKNAGVVVLTEPVNYEKENLSDKAIHIYIYMNNTVNENYSEQLKHQLFHNENYFLIEGLPVNKKMSFKKLISNSNYELGDFIIDNYGYKLDFDCKNTKTIRYSISCDGGWIYKGGGHLQMKSHPNPDNLNKIEEIAIYEVQEKE